jgi:hypothetical protein
MKHDIGSQFPFWNMTPMIHDSLTYYCTAPINETIIQAVFLKHRCNHQTAVLGMLFSAPSLPLHLRHPNPSLDSSHLILTGHNPYKPPQHRIF